MSSDTSGGTGSDQPPAIPRRAWRGRPRWVRWTAYASFAVVLLVVACGVAAVRTVRASFPQTTGTLDVTGLEAEVRVLRDDAGVPQVYASTAHDLFFAQGFVQAQDRFYEMDVRRHLTAGRLSELFGPATLDADKVVRTLGWRRVAEREVARLDSETQAHLEAYSEGVNAYLRGRSPAETSLEYTLLSLDGLDYAPEKWTPVDSVAWLKAMAWDLRGNMQDEIDRALASTRLDPGQVAELYPDYPYDRHETAIPGSTPADASGAAGDGGSGAAGRAPVVAALAQVRDALESLPAAVGTGDGVGSNAWVVDGAHSSTGQPLLANDPHLATSLPGVWHQMGLHCTPYGSDCPFDVAGFTFAGFPGVVIGHNRDVAWGMTNLRPDTTDLYLEGVEGERYRRGQRWVPFQRREETIRIAGEDAFTFTVRSTVHGPVLSDVGQTYATVGANAPDGGFLGDPGGGPAGPYAVSLAWTALQPSRTAEAIFAMNRATNWPAFRTALRDFAVPAQNVVYADRNGHIAYQVTGHIPERRAGSGGDYPAPGWQRRHDWTGRTIPFAALPSVLDPEEGFVVTANQPPVAPPGGEGIVSTNGYGYRSQRVRERLQELGTVSPEQLRELQLDTRNGFAPVLVPHLLRLDVGGPYYSAGKRLLARWDHTQPAGSSAAAYFNAVWRNVLLLTFGDDLPEAVTITGSERWFEVVRPLLEDPSSHWWDDRATDDVAEQRDDVLRKAMRQARDELTRLQSRRAARWTWGHQHTLTLDNQTLGQSDVGLVRRLLNRGGWRVGGGSGVVDATGWDVREGYEVTTAPSMRMVVSLADLDESTWVNLTGVSGHAFSEHYTDQTDLWASGRTRSWPFSSDAVRKATEDTLVLRPGPGGGSD